jgi:homeobox-leucine zipper protein
LLDNNSQHLQHALQQHHLLDQQIPTTTAESSDHAHNGMIRGRDSMDPLGDEFESRSGSENVDGDAVDADQDPSQRPRKKRYHRHTQHQIQEMEAYVVDLSCTF